MSVPFVSQRRFAPRGTVMRPRTPNCNEVLGNRQHRPTDRLPTAIGNLGDAFTWPHPFSAEKGSKSEERSAASRARLFFSYLSIATSRVGFAQFTQCSTGRISCKPFARPDQMLTQDSHNFVTSLMVIPVLLIVSRVPVITKPTCIKYGLEGFRRVYRWWAKQNMAISGQLCKRTHFSARESGRRMDMDGAISPILETKAERTEFPCTLCRNWMPWP